MMLRPLTTVLTAAHAVFLAVLLFTSTPAPAMERAWVFAAASTQPVMERLKPLMAEQQIDLGMSYAGSSTLARQIELGAGAGVDVFVSANVKWMNYLDERGLLEPGTRVTIATNRLALIIGPGAQSKDSLMAALGDGRLAMADPSHVPAGLYGREALENLGLWDSLKDRLAPTKDVTGALMLVARGEAPVGLVYTSDAMRTENVELIEILPASSHSPIIYQAAILKGRATEGMIHFLNVLTGPQGQQAFIAAGFGGKPE